MQITDGYTDHAESQEMTPKPRPYRQVARAEATEALHDRIADAFLAALQERWIADITLDEIARAAGTTRQTVIRFFGSKEGLIAPAQARFRESVISRRAFDGPATPRKVADAAFADYEAIGDFVLRLLAQEERFPELRGWLQQGRDHHRGWIADMFAPALQPGGANAARLLNQLVVIYDIYTWKLLRRDFGLSVEDAAMHMAEMADKLTKGVCDGL
jgi:AcrR family transcriptional regulator